MNKNTGYVLRIVLGGYLVWLGISILTQALNEKPSNMTFICVAGGFFIVLGAAYVIFNLIKLSGIKIKRKEKPADVDESVGEAVQEAVPAPPKLEGLTGGEKPQETEEKADIADVSKGEETAEAKPAESVMPEKAKEHTEKTEEQVETETRIKEAEQTEIEQQIRAERGNDGALAEEDADIGEIPDGEETQDAEEIETDYEEK